LEELTTEDCYRKRAEQLLRAFGGRLSQAPTSLSELLLAVDFGDDVPKEIVIIAPRSRQEAEPFLARLRSSYAQGKLVALLQGKVAQGGKATAYVCERGVCKLPTGDPDAFARQIQEVSPMKGQPRDGAAPSRTK